MLEFLKRPGQKQGLSVIIIGCSRVGATLVGRLEKEGHDITVIDTNPDKVSALMGAYDIMGIVGNGARHSVQMEAGVDEADVLIAVTGSDELNLLCCVVAKRAGHCDVIARLRSPDYSEDAEHIKEQLGLKMIINPEQESARSIFAMLSMPTAIDINLLFGGRAEVARVRVPSDSMLADKKISELSKELSGAVLICAVERNDLVFIPNGSFRLLAGDVISFVSPTQQGNKFLNKLGFYTKRSNDVLIIGGSRSAYYLADKLNRAGKTVTLIEKDEKRCQELSDSLPKAIIVNADGTDENVLHEVGIHRMGAIISLLGIDEENILIALYASRVTDARVVTKINRINFHEVLNDLDLGSVIYPKYMTTEKIVAYIRSKNASMNSNIENLHYLYDENVEVIEFKVEKESAITNKTFIELELKDNVLVTCIERNGKVIIPGGKDVILPGDSVCIVTTHRGFSDILEILK